MESLHNNDSQILCWNCEEIVHKYAVECPYCKKELRAGASDDTDFIESDLPEIDQTSKIAPIFSFKPPEDVLSDELIEKKQSNVSTSLLYALCSIICLLAGSFFLIFGVFLKLFSENGVLSFQWDASSWPFFIIPAIILLVVGFWAYSKEK